MTAPRLALGHVLREAQRHAALHHPVLSGPWLAVQLTGQNAHDLKPTRAIGEAHGRSEGRTVAIGELTPRSQDWQSDLHGPDLERLDFHRACVCMQGARLEFGLQFATEHRIHCPMDAETQQLFRSKVVSRLAAHQHVDREAEVKMISPPSPHQLLEAVVAQVIDMDAAAKQHGLPKFKGARSRDAYFS
jgi:hypothetical protein